MLVVVRLTVWGKGSMVEEMVGRKRERCSNAVVIMFMYILTS